MLIIMTRIQRSQHVQPAMQPAVEPCATALAPHSKLEQQHIKLLAGYVLPQDCRTHNTWHTTCTYLPHGPAASTSPHGLAAAAAIAAASTMRS